MKIQIVTASPKKRFSTSAYVSKVLSMCLLGHEVQVINLKTVRDYNVLLEQLPESDALVVAFPVYVDAIPSTLLAYLSQLEKEIKDKHYACRVYGINVCGFYEGHQCELALNMLENWSRRANLSWGGGLGIGAGEMLSIIRIMVPIGLFLGIFFPMELFIQIALYLLFSMGMFVNLYQLKNRIVKNQLGQNQFTTVWFCPRWLFVIFASLYWGMRALVCHGMPIWKLFEKPSDH